MVPRRYLPTRDLTGSARFDTARSLCQREPAARTSREPRPSPSITASPERTLRTLLAVLIIDALFVGPMATELKGRRTLELTSGKCGCTEIPDLICETQWR